MKVAARLLEKAGIKTSPSFGLAPADDVPPLLTVRVEEGCVFEVVLTKDEIIVLGQPPSESETSKPEDEWHNCDVMGCGSWHVLGREFLPGNMRR